jgi:murein DD-endopeptidase MepM/ murein hydrolase activator NlpD
VKRFAALAIMLCVSACIPRSPEFPRDAAPRLETDMATVLDERPVWENRPVIADETAAERDVHIVKAGDTGIAIARAYAVPWSRIVDANGLSDPFILRVGQRIRIPGAEAPAEQTMESRAAAFKLDIEDILTGGEPAQSSTSASMPAAPGGPLPTGIAVGEPSRFTGGFIWPARGVLTTRFGPAGEGEVNQGIEISTSPAASIRAASDGVVAFVGNNVAGYGGMILIRHGNGWITAYGRAASTSVTRGQTIKRGDVIGATGSGTGPKLYFEMRKGRVPMDPLNQLPPV